MADLTYTAAAAKIPDHTPKDNDVIGLVDPDATGEDKMQGCTLLQLKDYANAFVQSIYSGTFDVTTTPLVERLSTRTIRVAINNQGAANVNLGVGATYLEALNDIGNAVAAPGIDLFRRASTSKYIAYQAASGTQTITSVFGR